MSNMDSILTAVRHDLQTLDHRRYDQSTDHTQHALPSSSHAFSNTCNKSKLSFDATQTKNDPKDKKEPPHTGTSTCSCRRCVMPGSLSFAEYERHVDTKIEVGRREVKVIDEQLARCHQLMSMITELQAQVKATEDITSPAGSANWSVQVDAPTSPLAEGQYDGKHHDGPPSPLMSFDDLNGSVRSSRRQTICALSSLPSYTSIHQPRAGLSRDAGLSFNSVAASSFYSEQSAVTEDDDDAPLTLPTKLSVPRRASSTRQTRTARLSKPFSEKWVAHSPDAAVSAYDLLAPRSAPIPGYNNAPLHSNPPYMDKPLPPLQRTYTPRTQSTLELLGHGLNLGPDADIYDSAHDHGSSIFHRRRGMIAIQDSDDYDSQGSGRRTPQHSFRWQSQRGLGLRLKPKRRLSKADELLGLSPKAEERRRAGSVLSFGGTINDGKEGKDGKRSKLGMLGFSRLKKEKGSGE
jgi:hypothetical protein